MKILPLISTCLLPFSIVSLELVPDTANLAFLNPDLGKREVVKCRLKNELEVLLISDPDADLSAASLAVRCGSWDDPVDYPGMAHFCEHMLFMGSEKYPDENAFMSLLSNYGGISNAFTAEDRTVYMFSSREEGFLQLLDHFAHFYIDPLFDTSSIGRELHAVDQEFAKNIQNDGWRIQMIWKEMGNPKHPNQMFSIGNSETLSQIPQSALKKWHREHYGAGQMHLSIYSSLPMEVLQENVEKCFSEIPTVESVYRDKKESILSSRQRGHITYITPFQKLHAAILRWELPTDLAEDPSHPAQLFAFSLQRAQRQNLEEQLKREQLIDQISFSAETRGGNHHRFFEIYLYLTEKGLEQIDTTLLRCFEAIAGFKNQEIPSYLFEERNDLAKLHYQYQTRQDAFSYIQSIGESLPDEPLTSYPKAQLLGASYEPAKIQELLAFLTPQNCALTIVAPPEKTHVPTDRKERWFGAEYAIRPLAPELLTLWAGAKPHPAIEMAAPNPFVPTYLATTREEKTSLHPTLLSQNEWGEAYYARCPEFSAPEVAYQLHFTTPAIGADARSQVLAALYLDHLTDQLNPTLSAAAAAGLHSRFSLEKTQLQIQLNGFSEKAPLLLQHILENLTAHPPTRQEFDLYFARHEKAFSNAQKDLAYRQAKELIDSLINPVKSTCKQKLAALHTIRYEDFVQFCQTLFDEVYLEALFAGNLSSQQAKECWLDLLHGLSKKAYPKERHAIPSVLHLKESGGPYRIEQTLAGVQGNATLLLIDEGTFSHSQRGAQEILATALKESFFQELRTKQKTGYIAITDATEVEGHLYHYFLVQSNSHQPEDLLYRFELFLETYLQDLAQQISPERFETLRASAVESLKTRFRNLKTKASLWDYLAFQQTRDFAFVEKRIRALETLTYEECTNAAKTFFSRNNRKRLALLFTGNVTSPFSYEERKAEQIGEIAEYKNRSENPLEASSDGS